MIPGNHDFGMEKHPDEVVEVLSDIGITLLIDRGIEIDGIEFYGIPWTPQFGNWAYMTDKTKLREIWNTVPRSTDVLISHGPPLGVLDLTQDGVHAGSPAHASVVQYIKPRLNCFGHIHEAYGSKYMQSKHFNSEWKIDYINCCLTNFRYEMVNQPVVYELEV